MCVVQAGKAAGLCDRLPSLCRPAWGSASLDGTARLDGTQGRLRGLPAHNRGSVTAIRHAGALRDVGDPSYYASCACDLDLKLRWVRGFHPGFLLCCLLAALTRFTARKPPRAHWLYAFAHLCLLVVLQGTVTAWLQDCNARVLPGIS